jgi:hypothetical protein
MRRSDVTSLRKKRVTTTVVGIAIATGLLVGCSDKVKEPFRDAKRGVGNESPADTGSMPDGFSNYATKCDRPGIRVYVIFKGDKSYGDIAVIADPTCR